MKSWNPTEQPIALLGSIFDANSLGKWIYDWTVACCGRLPITEIAGDLWSLLIRLADNIKYAEEGLSNLRRRKHRELIEHFLEDGERLWQRFNCLLKVCEWHMSKEMRRDSSGKILPMSEESGRAFVDTIFGRDRELERTEELMTRIRLWNMRFDVNCNDILLNTRCLPALVSWAAVRSLIRRRHAHHTKPDEKPKPLQQC